MEIFYRIQMIFQAFKLISFQLTLPFIFNFINKMKFLFDITCYFDEEVIYYGISDFLSLKKSRTRLNNITL